MFLRAAPDPGFQPAYAKLPLSFEENRGQAPADVRYLSRTRSGVVLLRPGSFSLDVDGGQNDLHAFRRRRRTQCTDR